MACPTLKRDLARMVSACARLGDLDCALTVIDKMKERGWQPDSNTLNHLLWSPWEIADKGLPGGSGKSEERETIDGCEWGVVRGLKGVRRKRVRWVGGPPTLPSDCLARSKQDVPPFETRPWEELPKELLVGVLRKAGDERGVLIASAVCRGWREGLAEGVTELSLKWCRTAAVPAVVTHTVPRFQNLHALSLWRCPSLTDTAVAAVAASCHHLRILDLSLGSHLSDDALRALTGGCPKLESLDVSGCVRFTEGGFVALFSKCKELRAVNLCGCVGGVTDKVLRAMAWNCRDLQSVNLGWCDRVSDCGLSALAAGCPSLEVLDLCGCTSTTDRAVVALAGNCLRLRALGLHCCRLLTDRSIYALAASAAQRKELKIAGSLSPECTITTSTFSARHSGSQNDRRPKNAGAPQFGLLSLNVSGCVLLKAAAMQALCDAFPSLHTCPQQRSLNVSGCLALTNVRCKCRVKAL